MNSPLPSPMALFVRPPAHPISPSKIEIEEKPGHPYGDPMGVIIVRVGVIMIPVIVPVPIGIVMVMVVGLR